MLARARTPEAGHAVVHLGVLVRVRLARGEHARLSARPVVDKARSLACGQTAPLSAHGKSSSIKEAPSGGSGARLLSLFRAPATHKHAPRPSKKARACAGTRGQAQGPEA